LVSTIPWKIILPLTGKELKTPLQFDERIDIFLPNGMLHFRIINGTQAETTLSGYEYKQKHTEENSSVK
jgi:hypothetical protein